MASVYDCQVQKRDGSMLDLASLKGKVLLIVNTATGCGFTPQYEGLEKLYQNYHDKGLEILDLPCNQFGSQAPGTDAEIHEFCTLHYKTSFDQLAKIDVNGENASPLYQALKAAAPEDELNGMKEKLTMKTISVISKTCKEPGDIKWNFTKFLVDRNGNVVHRYPPVTTPEQIESDLAALI